MGRLELYGSRTCPYTAELRAELEWQGVDFVEYDVEADAEARRRFLTLSPGSHLVPVLVEDGQVTVVGWQGRGCYFSPES